MYDSEQMTFPETPALECLTLVTQAIRGAGEHLAGLRGAGEGGHHPQREAPMRAELGGPVREPQLLLAGGAADAGHAPPRAPPTRRRLPPAATPLRDAQQAFRGRLAGREGEGRQGGLPPNPESGEKDTAPQKLPARRLQGTKTPEGEKWRPLICPVSVFPDSRLSLAHRPSSAARRQTEGQKTARRPDCSAQHSQPIQLTSQGCRDDTCLAFKDQLSIFNFIILILRGRILQVRIECDIIFG